MSLLLHDCSEVQVRVSFWRASVLGAVTWMLGVPALGQQPATRTITPAATAVDRTAGLAYAVDEAGGNVVVLDLASGQRKLWKVGAAPDALVLDAGLHRLYVVNAGSGTVSVLNTTTGDIIAEPKTDHRPYVAGIDTVRHRVWVSNTFSNELTEIDGLTGAVKRLPLGSKDAIVVDERRGRVFLSSYEDAHLLFLDEGTGETRRLPAAVHTWAMAVDPANGHLWAAVIGSNELLEVDPVSGDIRRMKTGAMQDALAIEGMKAYVVEREAGAVEVFDLKSGRVDRVVPVGSRPGAIAADESVIWVANTASRTVTAWNEQCPKKIVEIPVKNAPYAIRVAGEGVAAVAVMGETAVEAVRLPADMQSCKR